MSGHHAAIPTGEWDDDGAGHCGNCDGRLIEAIYSGGWMHSREELHPFIPFVYADGAERTESGCVDCARSADAPIHDDK